jgi:hypothetical protein
MRFYILLASFVGVTLIVSQIVSSAAFTIGGKGKSATIDMDGDGKYEYVMETNMWNVASFDGYLKMTWNYSAANLLVDINLSNIQQLNPSSWVHAYPEIWYGAKPWNRLGPANDGLVPLPKKLSELNDFYVTVDYEVNRVDPNLPFNYCFETWLTKTTNRGISVGEGEAEIMVWLTYNGLQGAGSKVGTVNVPIQVDNQTRQVTYEIWNSDMGWEYFAFRPTTTIDKGKVRFNWAPFIQKAKEFSSIPDWPNLYFTVVELGSEFGSPSYLQAQLKWKVYDLKFEYTSTPILGETPEPTLVPVWWLFITPFQLLYLLYLLFRKLLGVKVWVLMAKDSPSTF